MNIDLNNCKHPDDLTTALDLAKVSFAGCDARTLIGSVWQSVEGLWKIPDERIYTDHSLAHSIGVLKYFMGLSTRYKWSEYEKLVMCVAALIHDIGMQYNVWRPYVNLADWPLSPINIVEVRKHHADSMYELIWQLLRASQANTHIDFPTPLCRTDNEWTIVHRAALIARCHSGDYIENAVRDQENFAPRTVEGNKYRPRLLAGTLRLCDEIHGDYTRIRQPECIWAKDLTDESRKHWFSCLFIEDVGLEDLDGSSIVVSLHWRVPISADQAVREKIRSILNSMRVTKTQHEVGVVNEFYEKSDEPQHKITVTVKLMPQASNFAQRIDAEFEDFLEHAVSERTQMLGRGDTPVFPTIIIGSGSEAPFIEAAARPSEDMPLNEALLTWLKANRRPGHFELLTGDHTDTYINCRTLVSDQSLLRKVAQEIERNLKAKAITISAVLAVGTSAIPLGVNLAFLLDAAVTFTMYSGSEKGPGAYHPLEVQPVIRKDSTVLIVDDVISGGKVAGQVCDIISRYKPSKIYHQTIYRLGQRQIDKDPRIEDYFSILHIDNVDYFSADNCALCKQGVRADREGDLHWV